MLVFFAFMYHVYRFEEEDQEVLYRSFDEAFFSTFSSFVGEPARAENWLDIVFGVVTVVILLNVVIAIVSKGWDDATQEASSAFWMYRLDFLQEISRGVRGQTTRKTEKVVSTRVLRLTADMMVPIILGGEEEEDSDEIPCFLTTVSWLWLKSRRAVRERWDEGSAPLWTYVIHRVLYAFYFFAGLVSFGLFWPMLIRKQIFETAGPHKSSLSTSEKLEDKSTTKDMEELQARMESLEQKMDLLLQQMTKLTNPENNK